MKYFCRLTQQLASSWFPPQEAYGIFELNSDHALTIKLKFMINVLFSKIMNTTFVIFEA